MWKLVKLQYKELIHTDLVLAVNTGKKCVYKLYVTQLQVTTAYVHWWESGVQSFIKNHT